MKLTLFEIKKINKHLDKQHVNLIKCALESKHKNIKILEKEDDRINNVLHLERIKNTTVNKIISQIKKYNKDINENVLSYLDEIKDLCTPTPYNVAEYYKKLEKNILKDLKLNGFEEYKDFRLKLSFDTINNKPSYFTLYILEDVSNGIFDICNIDLLNTRSLKDINLSKVGDVIIE